ncbi:MAG: hypothetical protein IPH55_11885 [Betaproteobacteria bacterium]|nr:hypothetical protein [Betaproteobacteria bacterium]
MLIVAAEFPPLKTIGRIRTVKFVEHLRQHGWHSVVVTLQPTGQEPIFDAKLLDEVAPEAEVIRLPLVTFDERITNFAKRILRKNGARTTHSQPARRSSAAAQATLQSTKDQPQAIGARFQLTAKRWIRLFLEVPDNYVPWAFAVVPRLRDLCRERKFDVIFTTLPPFSAAYVGYALTHETGVPWIADYRDLWFGDAPGMAAPLAPAPRTDDRKATIAARGRGRHGFRTEDPLHAGTASRYRGPLGNTDERL